MRQLFTYSGALIAVSVISVPVASAERFFLARNHSMAIVGYYAVAFTIATVLYVLPEQLVGPLLPGLTTLEVQGRFEEHRSLYRKGLAGLFLLVTPATLLLAFVAQPFFSIWAGPQYGLHSIGPFLILLGGIWLHCLAWVPYTYLLSSGRTKLLACIYIAEVGPYVVGAAYLTAHFGAVGAATIASAGWVFETIMMFAIVWRVARLPFSVLPHRRLRSIVAPILLGLGLGSVGLVTHALTLRAGCAAAFGLIYAAIVWSWVLTGRERVGLSRLLSSVIGPRFGWGSRAPSHARVRRDRTGDLDPATAPVGPGDPSVK
jgi:O-antigen/teichoic acid export membrane protein